MKINLHGFGSARELSGICFELNSEISIANFRVYLRKELPQIKHQVLLDTCAFATGQQVLNDDFVISQDLTLNVLPPVCGG